MGRGDKKTRRGKISRGSFGNRRPRLRNVKKKAGQPPGKAVTKPAAK
jgi:ribosomal small subunit protein bTHX